MNTDTFYKSVGELHGWMQEPSFLLDSERVERAINALWFVYFRCSFVTQREIDSCAASALATIDELHKRQDFVIANRKKFIAEHEEKP